MRTNLIKHYIYIAINPSSTSNAVLLPGCKLKFRSLSSYLSCLMQKNSQLHLFPGAECIFGIQSVVHSIQSLIDLKQGL